MDYIIKQLGENINLYTDVNEKKIYHQMRAEYSLMLMLSYLWNKNLNDKGFGKKKRLIEKIQKPTLGSIINIAKDLDEKNEFFKDENSIIFDYIDIRNNTIGHGYCFGEGVNDCINQLDEYYKSIVNLEIPIISHNTNLIFIDKYDDEKGIYTGFNYNYNGSISPWSCSEKIEKFEIKNIYATFKINEYHKISPFIHIAHPRKFYSFVSVEELLLGKLKYNRLDEQEQKIIIWEEIYKEFSATDGLRRRTLNNTIINEFDNNYEEFIDVGIIKDKIIEFLTGKKRNSSVCATVWGHGGVGKTATVQNICREISNDTKLNKNDKFDYIVFLSAKDRMYDTHLAEIKEIKEANRVLNYDDLIIKINTIVFKEENNTDTEKIINYAGRILIIIDDYETFSDEDKQKIRQLIEYLNINHHKILITTRNKFLVVGSEIQTDELNAENTKIFLLKVLEKYFKYDKGRLEYINAQLPEKDIITIHKITSGRPLFIFVFASYLVQIGSIELALDDPQIKNINTSKEANEFLFGKIFDQLAEDKLSQDIYAIIGLLTPEDKLTSLINHIKYILSIQEEKEAKFNNALKKLVDLKIIEISEKSFYKVYSKEIVKLMKHQFDNHSNKHYFKSRHNKLEKHITKDTGEALLFNADNARYSEKSEEFVISTYKEIINLNGIEYKTKVRALLNLTDYLFSHRGNKELAVNIFENFSSFKSDIDCVIMHAQYLWSLKEDKFKKKSIELLTTFYHNIKKLDIVIDKEKKIQILALLVLRKSLFWLDKTINKQEYKNIYTVHGNILFLQIKGIDVNKINANIRQDILTALLSLSEICLKIPELKKHTKEIASFVLNEIHKTPAPVRKQFEKKLKFVAKNIVIPQNKQRPQGQKAVENKIYRGSIKEYGLKENYGFIVVEELDRDIYFNEGNLRGCKFEDIFEYDLVDVIVKVWNGRYSIVNDNYSAWTVKSVYY